MIYRNETHWFEVQENTNETIAKDDNGSSYIKIDRNVRIFCWEYSNGVSKQIIAYDSKTRLLPIDHTDLKDIIERIELGNYEGLEFVDTNV